MSEFEDKEDELMIGFLAMEDARNYYVDLGKARRNSYLRLNLYQEKN